jgi:hypothetical protein
MAAKGLPVTLKNGPSASFKADLRLRVEAGAAADILGSGAGAELGIYVNLLEFVATLEQTPTCALETLEHFDLNAGAYVNLDVVVDYATFGAIPSVSTTLLSLPTATQCWLSAASTTAAASTSASAIKAVSSTSKVVTSTIKAVTSTSNAAVSTSKAVTSTSEAATSTSIAKIVTTSSKAASNSTITSSAPRLTGTGHPVGSGFPVSSGFPVASASGASATGKYPFTNDTLAVSATDAVGMVTSTFYKTSLYTVTSCAATIVNCPASLKTEVVLTKTIDAYTTVCPVTATESIVPVWSTTASVTGSTPTTSSSPNFTDVVYLTHLQTPEVNTLSLTSTVEIKQVVGTYVAVPISSTQVVTGASSSATDAVSQFSIGASASSFVAKPTGGSSSVPYYPVGGKFNGTFSAHSGGVASGVAKSTASGGPHPISKTNEAYPQHIYAAQASGAGTSATYAATSASPSQTVVTAGSGKIFGGFASVAGAVLVTILFL